MPLKRSCSCSFHAGLSAGERIIFCLTSEWHVRQVTARLCHGTLSLGHANAR